MVFLRDLNLWGEDYRKRFEEKGSEYFSKISQIKRCYEELSIFYKYYREEEKAKKMFQLISSIRLPKSKFYLLNEEQLKDHQAMDILWRMQIDKGAQLNLAGKDPELAKQLFEWAAENLQSETITSHMGEPTFYIFTASWYLWRGYALLMLGRYEEAYDNLKEVMPYFTLHKKKGGETWQKLEYYLTKALIPLCEYMLSPCADNRKNARKGIEEYIKSLKYNYDKQCAYLYYFHLKERFPEVYGEAGTIIPKQSPAIKTSAAKPAKPAKPLDVISDAGKKYFIRMITSDELLDEDLGSNRDLERYVEMIKALGDYPVLSSLMNVYVGEGEQKPEPLVEECERLLATPGLDENLTKKTEQILRIAEKAKLYHLCLRIEYVDLSL